MRGADLLFALGENARALPVIPPETGRVRPLGLAIHVDRSRVKLPSFQVAWHLVY